MVSSSPDTPPGSPVSYRGGVLHLDEVSLQAIAQAHGTPSYVYSRRALEERWRAFDLALAAHEHLVCYAVKANGNLAVLDVLARLGSGFDIVSVGELERVIAAGGSADRTVFAGVGKREDEIERALEAGVMAFNVESSAELTKIADVARAAAVAARVSVRVNPDVDAGTHPYISTGLRESKFGVPIDEAPSLYRRAASDPWLDVVGVDSHIGSQQTSTAPFADALERLLRLVDDLHSDGIELRHLNAGGGMGIVYRDEAPPTPSQYAAVIGERVAERGLKLIVEPGRSIVGESGVLLTRVHYRKRNGERCFAVVDAAMNDFLRPALYDAWHEVLPVLEAPPGGPPQLVDVVGPVCESADFIAKGRAIPAVAGDLLAIQCAGAYGFVMSSNYNARPRAAEVMVDGASATVVRRRETEQELFASEQRLPEA